MPYDRMAKECVLSRPLTPTAEELVPGSYCLLLDSSCRPRRRRAPRDGGANYIIFMMNFATLEQKTILASMEFMAQEVIPRFAGV